MSNRRRSTAKFALLWLLLADENLSASAKLVAAALLLRFHNTKTGQCNPSFETIAKIVGRKRRSVIDAIAELKTATWLEVLGTGGGPLGKTNQYVLNPPPVQSAAPLPVQDTAPVQSTAPGGAVHCPRTTYLTTLLRRESGGGEIPPSRAPDGAAEKEGEANGAEIDTAMARSELVAQFELLRALWRKPQGIDRKKSLKAFEAVCAEHDGDDVLRSAGAWVAKVEPQMLPRLEDWLANGGWENPPPPPRANSQRKRSAAAVAADLARGEGGEW